LIDDPMLYEQEPADAGFFTPEEFAEEAPAPKTKLQRLIESDNIAEDLSEDKLKKIGRRCSEGFEVDEKSREEWLTKTKDAIKLANQVAEQKTSPWPGAANVKLPLITDASIKFAARAYSEIIRNNQVAKGKVVGADPDGSKAKRSNRVGDFCSWQLLEQETEWEPDTDKLLHCLPLVGHMFRKRYYCPQEKRTKSEICMPDKIAINQQAASIETARRVTHIIENVSKNDVVGNQRAGIWLDIDFREQEEKDRILTDDLEKEDYYTFLEQQCWLDLDEDGYEEPYIVTLEKESMKVARIVANYGEDDVANNDAGKVMRIKPRQCLVDYIFIPSMDGSYYGTGFGQLMGPLNKAANTVVNQLLDSGTLSIMQCGYLSKEVKLYSGTNSFTVGEWKRTQASAEQLRNGVFPLPTKEPSPTLFNLLGLIMELTQDLSSVKDVLGGDAPGGNVPATTVMALIEQGMKTFNAIYKRIYRSLKSELKQLCELNYLYLDDEEYINVLDDQEAFRREDFNPEGMDIIPVADPNMSSEMQRLAQAEALKSAIGMPGVDPKPIMQMWLDALRIPSDKAKAILPDQDPNGVPPHIQQMMHDVEMKGADIANKEREIDLKERELTLKEREFEVKALETISKAILNFANAEGAEAGQQMAMYKSIADSVLKAQQIDNQAAVATQKAQTAQPESPTA
jgi:chaperonin GroES